MPHCPALRYRWLFVGCDPFAIQKAAGLPPFEYLDTARTGSPDDQPWPPRSNRAAFGRGCENLLVDAARGRRAGAAERHVPLERAGRHDARLAAVEQVERYFGRGESPAQPLRPRGFRRAARAGDRSGSGRCGGGARRSRRRSRWCRAAEAASGGRPYGRRARQLSDATSGADHRGRGSPARSGRCRGRRRSARSPAPDRARGR